MELRSSEPFWLLKNGIINSYPSLRKNLSTEILIIGGGITGSLIAHQSMEDGRETVLIDRREIGNGSTAVTTSMLQYELDVPLLQLIDKIGKEGAVASYRACSIAIDELEKISDKVKSTCGYKKKESLYFAAYKKDISGLFKEYELRKENGFAVKWLDADLIQKEYGLTGTYGGILSKQGASMDAFRLTHDILRYNFEKGLGIYDKTTVKKIKYRKSGVSVLLENGCTIHAKKLIYCNGYESTEIIREKFVDLLSTFAVVGERMENGLEKVNGTLFWNTADPYIYMRTTDDGRILIGGADEEFVNIEKRDALISKKSQQLKKDLLKVFPDFDLVVDFAWAGTFGETRDGLPYIGRHGEFPSTYFVLGFGGNGITFSVIGMEMISEMLKGKKHHLEKYFKFGR